MKKNKTNSTATAEAAPTRDDPTNPRLHAQIRQIVQRQKAQENGRRAVERRRLEQEKTRRHQALGMLLGHFVERGEWPRDSYEKMLGEGPTDEKGRVFASLAPKRDLGTASDCTIDEDSNAGRPRRKSDDRRPSWSK